MAKEITIKDILGYLESKKYKFTFHGKKEDKINDYSTLFNYKDGTLTFVSTLNSFADYHQLFKEKKIQLIIMGKNEKDYDCFSNIIRVEKPKSVFFGLLDYFYTDKSKALGAQNEQFKHSYVSKKSVIGKNVEIGIGCIIEDDVYIGDNTVIHHNVTVRNKTRIGNNCTILSGTIIGENGFNPLKTEDGKRQMLNHYGGVTIEDNVHVGDNCNIARGTIDDTIIRNGVKMNKQVIVAHNVEIKEDTVITAPTFICGSVDIGKNCHIAATTIRNQCTIGDGAVLGLGSVVVKDVKAEEVVVGNPAKPLKKNLR